MEGQDEIVLMVVYVGLIMIQGRIKILQSQKCDYMR